MISDALAAIADMFSPAFRAALVQVLALTLALLVLAGAALDHALIGLVALPYPWLATTLSLLAGLGLAAGSVFLVAPVSAVVAGFFVDRLAETVERRIDPSGPRGRPLPLLPALGIALRFAGLSLAVTLLAFALLLVPGVNALAFLGANAYLSGRQYFDFVAMRHLPPREAAALRQRHGARVLLAGFGIALFLSVPVLNLLTPLFATALTVRVFKRLAAERPANIRAPLS